MIEITERMECGKRVFVCSEDGIERGCCAIMLEQNAVLVGAVEADAEYRELLTRTVISAVARTGLVVISRDPSFVRFGFEREGERYVLRGEPRFERLCDN